MTLDELKTSWQQAELKLQASQSLNQRIVESMIGERSRSRVASILRQYLFGSLLTIFWFSISVAVLAGNPFDYRNTIEYTPVALLSACFLLILTLTISAYASLKRAELHGSNLVDALQQVIAVYEKPRRLLKFTVITMFSSSLMFPLSFLPRKLAHTGLLPALVDTLLPMLISLLLYGIAHKLGAFKDTNAHRFRNDLIELQELERMARN